MQMIHNSNRGEFSENETRTLIERVYDDGPSPNQADWQKHSIIDLKGLKYNITTKASDSEFASLPPSVDLENFSNKYHLRVELEHGGCCITNVDDSPRVCM